MFVGVGAQRWIVGLFVTTLAHPALALPAPQGREASEVPLAVGIEGTEGIDDPLVRVASLINDGQALFDTADFLGAIDKWTQAYATLPDDPDILTARNLLTYQIAQAHIEAHAIDGQPTHLRKADRLLVRYLEGLRVEESEARASAEKLRQDLHVQIAGAPAPVVIAEAPPPPPPPLELRRRISPLSVAGGITLGLGGALLVGTVVAAIAGNRIDRDGELAVARGAGGAELDALLLRGNRANYAAIGTAVAGALLVTTGAALLIAGRIRRTRVTATPTLGQGLFGLSLAARF